MITNVILLTVPHTGTQYFLKGLQDHYERATYSHLNDTWRRKTNDVVYTTFRNPLRVAASWANRGEFEGKGTEKWMNIWKYYDELEEINPLVLFVDKGTHQHGIQFPPNPVNTFPDKRGMHKALNKKDMDYFYSKVPKYGIKHALKCGEWVKDGQAQRSNQ